MRIYRILPTKRFYLLWFVFLTSFTIYTEIYLYYKNTFSWNKLECKNKQDCLKILLVADPQIIGDFKEAKKVTPFSIFDSDRYLRKTYLYAYNFVKPDVIIFLGDLMDEGNVATDKEFYNYVRRVFNIFLYGETVNVKHIWLPGDNDIGGEDFDVRPRKLKRFERAFSQSELIKLKNLTFFKINRMTLTVPVYKKQRDFYDSSKIFIGLSHIPLIFLPSVFVEKVLTKMLPHVIFTAHEHKSMIVSTDALLREDFHVIPVNPADNKLFEYVLGVTDMYEIVIPTCSYRMGTKNIGYGYAHIEKNYLRFTVLWSLSRFDQLISYLIVLICFFVSNIIYFCCRHIF